MKKSYFLFPCMISFLLTSCSMRNAAESSSNSSTFSDVSETHTNSAVSESSDLIETHEIIFYNSICDVQEAELTYGNPTSNMPFHEISKDGNPWIGAPGCDQFGSLCFSDGENFYIQCFLSYYDDQLSTDFRWFCVNFNHFDEQGIPFLDDETINKIFIRAEGNTLYTADGYHYTLRTVPYCKNGTCKK